ncbi:MAG: hypothetical protein VXZ53_13465, partial [Planctomycetota bacterium]|nr:hypothetical protein [Planctomycetota bacterium]
MGRFCPAKSNFNARFRLASPQALPYHITAAMKAVRGRFPPLVPCGLNCTVSSRDPMAVATQMFLPTTHV